MIMSLKSGNIWPTKRKKHNVFIDMLLRTPHQKNKQNKQTKKQQSINELLYEATASMQLVIVA